MGQKISPIGLRLGITHKHQSQWFVDPLEIHTAPAQNLSLFSNKQSKNSNRQLIENTSENKELNSSKNETQPQTLNETYDSSLIGLNLKSLQQDLGLALAKYKGKTLSLVFSNPLNTQTNENLLENNKIPPSSINLGILVKQLNQPFQYASIFAKYLATQLEKRENTVKQAFNRIKIKVSGRLNGTDIAEHKSLFKGRIPLSSLEAKIDYSYETAKTLYGILGVKVWIWREEN
uniref:ribosomal protein S3 n=1 Tax=Cephaleuros lagerheimii TaxID=2738443 RepID=UPI003001C919